MSFALRSRAPCCAAPLLALSVAAHSVCPAPLATAVLERFIDANCEACWRSGDASTQAQGNDPFVLDWIVPGAAGDGAALSPAALVEATARAGALPADTTLHRRHVLPLQPGLGITLRDGPPWYGYIGLQLAVQHADAALPVGAVAYLALVENVAPGEEGTPAARRLVRALAGPLPLATGRTSSEHLQAMRIPFGARPERLSAVAWIEAPAGRLVALAGATPLDCSTAK